MASSTHPTLKTRIVKAARKRVLDIKPAAAKIEKSCLYHAGVLVQVMREHGIHDAYLQGGSAGWARLTKEQDDGKDTTFPQYSYIYGDCGIKDLMAILEGNMPEMHVWVYRLSTDEYIDLTTCYQEKQCQEMIGADWPGKKLPEYLWAKPAEMPKGCFYNAHPHATRLAHEFYHEATGVELVPGTKSMGFTVMELR